MFGRSEAIFDEIKEYVVEKIMVISVFGTLYPKEA
jgi:hypothetical protein